MAYFLLDNAVGESRQRKVLILLPTGFGNNEKVPTRRVLLSTRRKPDEEAKIPDEESTDEEFPARQEVCCTLDPRSFNDLI